MKEKIMTKNKDGSLTFLGLDTEAEGKLTFDGTLRIDGHYKGEIVSSGNLIVGEEGLIEADIQVSYIVIQGEIHGNILADQRVDIRSPAKVFGNIEAPTVIIDEGAIFECQTKMYRAKEQEAGGRKPKTPAVDSQDYVGSPPPNVTAIYGIVSHAVTNVPIRNAEIKCQGVGKKKTKTNASGYYEVINLEDGKWFIKIAEKGFKKYAAEVEISEGETHQQNIELSPKK